jgi:hypothetical protein
MAHQAITSNNLNMLVDKPVSGLRCELLSDKLLGRGTIEACGDSAYLEGNKVVIEPGSVRTRRER